MAIECSGTGEPTIIVENDLGYYEYVTVTEVTPNDPRPGSPLNLMRYGRACRYTHAGSVDLREKVTGKRTAADLANDLHSLVNTIGLPGPYIFVTFGDSSYIALMYASQYPDEVVGMVCVACTSPTYRQVLLKMLEAAAPTGGDEIQVAVEMQKKWLAGSTEDLSSYEKLDKFASYQQAVKITSLGNLPLVQLLYEGPKGDTISALNKIKYEALVEAANDFAKLSTHSKVEVIPGSNARSDLSTFSTPYLTAVQEVYDLAKSAGAQGE
jgi:pimeloyl-ACP methyl ester carboxylesterase